MITADEAGFLLHARVLGGGMAPEMGSSPFHRGGYSLLVAPVLSLDLDPVLAQHGVPAVKAVLAASIAPLLYLLLTRCLDAGRPAAAWPRSPTRRIRASQRSPGGRCRRTRCSR